MTSIRKFRGERCYAKISNKLLQNSKLSFKARGLMAYILSLPDNWELCCEHLYTCSEFDGRTAVQSAIKELVAFGYLAREIVRDEATNRIVSAGYFVFDDPAENKQFAALPVDQESLVTGNLSLGERATTKETLEIKETEEQKPAPDGADVPLPFNSPAFVKAWAEWLQYRRERHLPKLKPTSLRKQFKLLMEWGEAASIASIDRSIAQGWQGLFPPPAEGAKGQFTPPKVPVRVAF